MDVLQNNIKDVENYIKNTINLKITNTNATITDKQIITGFIVNTINVKIINSIAVVLINKITI